VLRRLAGLGLIDAGAALQTWPLRRSLARELLNQAAARAASRSPAATSPPVSAHVSPPVSTCARPPAVAGRATVSLARSILSTWLCEHPLPVDAALVANARVRSGWMDESGLLLGGWSTRGANGAWQYGGPVPGPAGAGAFVGLDTDITWNARAAAVLRTSPRGTLEDAHIGIVAGPVDIMAGRIPLVMGVGRGGGIVLSPQHAFDGVGVRTSRAIAMPGVLGFLGDVRGTLMVSRFERSGPVRRPWFSAASLSFAPARSLHIGFQRAAIFGGDGNVQSLSARNLLFLLFGMTSQGGKDSGFENQVASIDAWARFEPFGVPLAVYGELGVDDVGFTLLSTAAFIAGIELPAVPGLPALSIGMEHARFPHSCCTHPPWYRHGDLAEGWTDRGWPLGHPLGGEGREWAMYWGAVVRNVWLSGRAFTRHRGEENLFSPARAGRSHGNALRVDAPFARNLAVNAAFTWERGGENQDHWRIELGARLRLTAGSTRNTRADDRAASWEWSPER
jgi:hypothetical protein